ncbi:MAG TPA: hypothetical protein VFL80_05595 [Thermoanaerobaculia bacterium]|nr:hypothetical protein [Thermoanaerobaculia bacterium]
MRKAALLLMLGLAAAGCTGGQEGTAAEEQQPPRQAPAPTAASVDATAILRAISPAIPIYADAQFREDLARRDQVMIRNQYGPGAEVYTMATDDSYPQVFHYYMTYLAQFRGFPPENPYPPERENWRTREVHLNPAMQDPFIPGETIPPDAKQVILQIAETEAEPKTVIRYIVTPQLPATAVAPPAAVSAAVQAAP